MADLLIEEKPVKRATQLERLGVDIVCIHTGIDAQNALHSKMKANRIVRSIIDKLRIPVAAAGGVDPGAAKQLVLSGVSLVIVGGRITGSKDPARATRRIVQSVSSL